ncbi:hypothetical protein P9139_00820 [Curtobacterium flaccumfaciens]|nr:hypothetical protein P9139_00820 [Curtobacterium flaccumfaciens]
MTEHHEDPSLLTGAHALDAVSDDERALLETTLSTSPELQAETDSLRETALQLAYAVTPIEPPASLKASLMAQIASMPQAAPVTDAVAASESVAAPASESVPAATPGSVAAPASGPVAAPVSSPVADDGLEARPAPATDRTRSGGPAAAAARRRWFQRPAAVLSAAAAVAVVFLGVGLGVGTSFAPSNGPARARRRRAADSTASTRPRTSRGAPPRSPAAGRPRSSGRTSSASPRSSWTGSLRLRRTRPTSFWYIGSEGSGGKIRSAGLMDDVSDGVHSAVLSGTMSHGVTIGMTVEPAGVRTSRPRRRSWRSPPPDGRRRRDRLGTTSPLSCDIAPVASTRSQPCAPARNDTTDVMRRRSCRSGSARSATDHPKRPET